MGIIELVFILIALLMCLNAIYPNFDFSTSPVVAINRLVGLLIGLLVLYIIYLIIFSLLGDFPLPHR